MITILIVLWGLLAIGCGQETEDAAAEEGMNENEELHPVEVVEAELGDFTQYTTKTGSTEAIKSISISPQLQEEISEIQVALGERVNKGDKLLTLDDENLRNQLKQAQAGLEVAEATLDEVLAGTREEELIRLEAALEEAELSYEQVKKSYQRQQRLFEEGMIAEESFEQSELNYIGAKSAYQSAQQSLKMAERGATEEELDVLRAQLAQAEASLEAAEISLAKTQLIAPSEGIISQINIEEGEMATGEPVISLVDLSQIELRANLSERNVNKVEVGQEIEAYFAALDESYSGEITYISPVAEERSRRFPVEVIIDNPEEEIKAGMYARVELAIEDSRDEVLIPQRALLSDEEGDFVFVVEGEQARRREVEVGSGNSAEVVILSGLEAGEQVIVSGHQQDLFDGDVVEVINRGDY